MNLRDRFDISHPDFPTGTPFWKDSSFQAFLEFHPDLVSLTTYLPSDLKSKVFKGQEKIEAIWSSYKDHGYGYLFYALTRVLKPKLCVEIGVLQGFSLLAVAAALRDNNQNGINYGIDLFEDYPYHHETFSNVMDRIQANDLSSWAQIQKADALQSHKLFDSADFLHVDISNNGDTFHYMFEKWSKKVSKVIVFEGGSLDRDQVEWMKKYNKPLISPVIDNIRKLYPDWKISVLEPFPSLTVAIRIAQEKPGLNLILANC